jgi:hypothetical protein
MTIFLTAVEALVLGTFVAAIVLVVTARPHRKRR